MRRTMLAGLAIVLIGLHIGTIQARPISGDAVELCKKLAEITGQEPVSRRISSEDAGHYALSANSGSEDVRLCAVLLLSFATDVGSYAALQEAAKSDGCGSFGTTCRAA